LDQPKKIAFVVHICRHLRNLHGIDDPDVLTALTESSSTGSRVSVLLFPMYAISGEV